jgi:hypothetical protein
LRQLSLLATFEAVSNDPKDKLPSYRCLLTKKHNDYQFSAIDIFIDYFCGSTLNYPIIWGQLIGNSKNKNLRTVERQP